MLLQTSDCKLYYFSSRQCGETLAPGAAAAARRRSVWIQPARVLCVETRSWPNKYFLALTKYFPQEILRNGLDKSVSGVTHLDLAAHGTVSLSRCSTLKPTSGSVHSLPSAQVAAEIIRDLGYI